MKFPLRFGRTFALASAFLAVFVAGTSANMLNGDVSNFVVTSFADRKWEVQAQTDDSIRMGCIGCEQQVLVNVQVSDRITFGKLGPEAAEKAKEKCQSSTDKLLQCDTIKGLEIGDVLGLLATKKVTENFFITSYIIGDTETLFKITTKASSKETAGLITQEFFETIKAEIIKP